MKNIFRFLWIAFLCCAFQIPDCPQAATDSQNNMDGLTVIPAGKGMPIEMLSKSMHLDLVCHEGFVHSRNGQLQKIMTLSPSADGTVSEQHVRCEGDQFFLDAPKP